MKKPIISVLVPTYNRPTYLKECIENILEQEWFKEWDIEIIICDNSENDDTKKMIEEEFLWKSLK